MSPGSNGVTGRQRPPPNEGGLHYARIAAAQAGGQRPPPCATPSNDKDHPQMKGDYTAADGQFAAFDDKDHPQMKGDYTSILRGSAGRGDKDHPQMKGDYTAREP